MLVLNAMIRLLRFLFHRKPKVVKPMTELQVKLIAVHFIEAGTK